MTVYVDMNFLYNITDIVSILHTDLLFVIDNNYCITIIVIGKSILLTTARRVQSPFTLGVYISCVYILLHARAIYSRALVRRALHNNNIMSKSREPPSFFVLF